MNTIFITGVTGQCASYLAEHCLEKGHKVIGLKRRTSTRNLQNIECCISNKNFILEEGDITDYCSTFSLLKKYRPEYIYNLAAMSHVKTSFGQPFQTIQANLIGPLNFLESIRELQSEYYKPRFITASTSEMFGSHYSEKDGRKCQGIDTEFSPNSPYGVAKLAAHNLVRIYRDGYNLQSYAYISHNHESPRRSEEFVTRKITKYVGSLARAKEDDFIPNLRLGNLEAYRDWSHAKDIARAVYMILNSDSPKEYVISSDECHSVREFCELAFQNISLNYEEFVVIDPEFYRPVEVEYLCGKSDEIRIDLGWRPEYSFYDLVREMVEYDING